MGAGELHATAVIRCRPPVGRLWVDWLDGALIGRLLFGSSVAQPGAHGTPVLLARVSQLAPSWKPPTRWVWATGDLRPRALLRCGSIPRRHPLSAPSRQETRGRASGGEGHVSERQRPSRRHRPGFDGLVNNARDCDVSRDRGRRQSKATSCRHERQSRQHAGWRLLHDIRTEPFSLEQGQCGVVELRPFGTRKHDQPIADVLETNGLRIRPCE